MHKGYKLNLTGMRTAPSAETAHHRGHVIRAAAQKVKEITTAPNNQALLQQHCKELTLIISGMYTDGAASPRYKERLDRLGSGTSIIIRNIQDSFAGDNARDLREDSTAQRNISHFLGPQLYERYLNILQRWVHEPDSVQKWRQLAPTIFYGLIVPLQARVNQV